MIDSIYSTDFLIKDRKETVDWTKKQITKETGKSGIFSEPEYDFVRPELQEKVAKVINGVAEQVVDKVIAGRLFSENEIQKIKEETNEGFGEETVKGQDEDTSDLTPEQTVQFHQTQRELIAKGYLQIDVDKKGEPVSAGGEMAKFLEDYNDLFVARLAAQGLEAKIPPDKVIFHLQEKYPDYPKERLAQTIEKIQEEAVGTGGISETQLFIKILGMLSTGNKLRMTEIAALTAVSTVGNLSSVEAMNRGIVTQDAKMLIAGLVGIGVVQAVDVAKGIETNKLMTKLMEGEKGYEGLTLGILKKVFDLSPEISKMNAASLTLQSPKHLENQIALLAKVAESIPTKIMPSLINLLLASSYLFLRSPDLAVSLAPIIYGGGQSFLALKRAGEMKEVRMKENKNSERAAKLYQDLQAPMRGDVPSTVVSGEDVLKTTEERRKIAEKSRQVDTKYGLANISSYTVLGLATMAIDLLGGSVNFQTILSRVNAQKNESEAIEGISGAIAGIKPLLHILTEFHDEIEGASEKRGKSYFVPNRHDISLREVRMENNSGEPFLDIGTLEIKQGEKVQLSGGNGSGKSTLIGVLFGQQPDTGLITVGEHTLGETKMGEYRKQIALKPQEPITVDGSLGVNLGGVNYDHETASAILTEYGFPISDLEAKISSSYSKNKEGGTSLSGGQRQVLALLRVEYQLRISEKNKETASQHWTEYQQRGSQTKKETAKLQSEIRNAEKADIRTIIIDEPTNDLDSKSKEAAVNLVKKWMDDPKRTVLLVSHDPDVQKIIDEHNARKIVLDKGKILP